MTIKVNLIVKQIRRNHFMVVKQVRIKKKFIITKIVNLVLTRNQVNLFVEKRNLHSKERKVLILKSTNSSSDLIEVRKMWSYCNYL